MWKMAIKTVQLEGAHECACLRQVNFYTLHESRVTWSRPFTKIFMGVMSGLSLETCTSNLKSVALTVLELLAFNAQNFLGSRDPGHVPFSKIFLRGRVQTVPGNVHVKFEVRSFNHFGAIIDRSAACTHTHRQTHVERKQYLRHSLCLLGGDKSWMWVCGIQFFFNLSTYPSIIRVTPGPCGTSWDSVCFFTGQMTCRSPNQVPEHWRKYYNAGSD